MRVARALVLVCALAAAIAPATANQMQSEARVTNDAPDVASITFKTRDDDSAQPGLQIAPEPGIVRRIVVDVAVEDDNGHRDVRAVQVEVRAPGNTSTFVGPFAAKFESGRGRGATYAAGFDLPSWSAAGVYTVVATIQDAPAARGTGYASFEVLESLALGVGSSDISFGTLSPGAVTSPASVAVSNHGNVAIDLEVSGTALASADASIPAGRIRTGLSSGGVTSPLAIDPMLIPDFDLAPGQDASRLLWFQLHVPSGDEQYVPQGTYRGTIALSAVVSG